MRLTLTLTLLCIMSAVVAIGQAGDFPDHRSKRELYTRMQEKDLKADLATFTMAGIDESVGKIPLRTIPVTATGKNFITFSGSGIKVHVTTAPFDGTKHKLGFYENKYLVKIDNKPFFGDYGKMPKTQIEKLVVTVGADTVAIPAAAWFDLYNPILFVTEGGVEKTNNKVLLSGDGRKIYIYMLKQEAGGSYEVTWIIQDGKYVKRVVDFGFLK